MSEGFWDRHPDVFFYLVVSLIGLLLINVSTAYFYFDRLDSPSCDENPDAWCVEQCQEKPGWTGKYKTECEWHLLRNYYICTCDVEEWKEAGG